MGWGLGRESCWEKVGKMRKKWGILCWERKKLYICRVNETKCFCFGSNSFLILFYSFLILF